jgi:hypothetical protein
MSLISVNAIIILNAEDGSRVLAKYYNAPHHAGGHGAGVSPRYSHLNSTFFSYATKYQDTGLDLLTDNIAAAPSAPYPDLKSQKAFEKGLLEKTAKQTADIILYDNRIVLYKSESDVMMYVVGGMDENEIMLYNVILALRDSLHLLFKYVLLLWHEFCLASWAVC